MINIKNVNNTNKTRRIDDYLKSIISIYLNGYFFNGILISNLIGRPLSYDPTYFTIKMIEI